MRSSGMAVARSLETAMTRRDLIHVAVGSRPATLIVRRGKLVNVLTREIYPADIAVFGDRIAAVVQVNHTEVPDTVVIDAADKYVDPEYIDHDVHVHDKHDTDARLPTAVTERCTV